jgi:hypothetical protein
MLVGDRLVLIGILMLINLVSEFLAQEHGFVSVGVVCFIYALAAVGLWGNERQKKHGYFLLHQTRLAVEELTQSKQNFLSVSPPFVACV